MRAAGRVVALTHTYTGRPMVRQARAMARGGRLGAVRAVQVEYAQDWLAAPLEGTGHKQAERRTDPDRAGAGGCLSDIGTHAHNLAGFVTGLAVEEPCAGLATFVPGRRLDDDVRILLRYRGSRTGGGREAGRGAPPVAGVARPAQRRAMICHRHFPQNGGESGAFQLADLPQFSFSLSARPFTLLARSGVSRG